jgi:hypothetical protein
MSQPQANRSELPFGTLGKLACHRAMTAQRNLKSI